MQNPENIQIVAMNADAIDEMTRIWNGADQLLPCSANLLREKTFDDPDIDDSLRLVAVREERLVGFAVAARRSADRGHVKLLATEENCRRQGIGSALLAALESAVRDRGTATMRIGEAAPNYLAPGIHQKNKTGCQFFEAMGYQRVGEALNMTAHLSDRSFDTQACEATLAGEWTFRRAGHDDQPRVNALLGQHWPSWKPEVAMTFFNSPISLHVAVDAAQRVMGFAAYDANNRGTGWFGPMGTDPAATGNGIGRILLSRCLHDLKTAGHSKATIPWVEPVGFYERNCGASVTDRFWRMEKRLV